MKTFIVTIGIFILSMLLTDGRSSSQGVIIEDRVVNTYTDTEMLMHHLVSRIKLSRCEVLLLSINQDLEQERLRDEPEMISFVEILHNLDSLDNEIRASKKIRNK